MCRSPLPYFEKIFLFCLLFVGLLLGVGLVCWLGGGVLSEWAMLVPACIVLSLLFIDSCENKSELYMDSQPQEGVFNMVLCWACDKIRISHIETGAEKRCKHKKQLFHFADLWNS